MVASLSRQQIRLIKERISDEGVSTAELAEDLLDYLCTSIEEEMQSGLSFEKAFEKVFNNLEEDELKLTEMKTQELLEGKKAYYPDLAQSFGIMVLLVLWSVIITGLATAIDGGTSQSFINNYYPFFLIITNLIVFVPVLGYAMREIKKSQGKAPIFSFRPVSLSVYLAIAGIALLSQCWMEPLARLSLVSLDAREKIIEPLWQHGLLGLSIVIIVNSILVELLFRGIILKGLLKTLTPVKAILWSSLFFIAINPVVPVFIFTLGLMLGWLYWKTKSLYPIIFMLVFGTIGYYSISFFTGHWGKLFSWQEWVGSLWLYVVMLAISFLLTAGLFYYLHRKLSAQN